MKQLHRTLIVLVAISILTIAVRAPQIDIPFERDEGEYAYIAWRLSAGELPYRDWFDQKPPAIFWVYRAALSLPFEAVRSVHIMAGLFSWLSAIGIYLIARRYTGDTWGALTALLMVLLSADPLIQGFAANTEIFMQAPLIMAYLLFLDATDAEHFTYKRSFLAGMLCGCAMMFKQVAVFNWLFLVAATPFMLSQDNRLRGSRIFIVGSSLGITVVAGVTAFYFYSNGALKDFVYHVFSHNLHYASALPITERLQNFAALLTNLARSQSLIWLFSLIGLRTLINRRDLGKNLFFPGWFIAGFVGASTSGFYFPHYFQQLLPPLAVICILGLKSISEARWWGRTPVWGRKAAAAVSAAVLPCYVAFPYWTTYTPQEAIQKIYPQDSFADMQEYGRLINSLTNEGDRVYIFGSEPEVLFYARRASATRYIILFPLYGPYADVLEKQTETVREISTIKPAAALYLPNSFFFSRGAEQYLTSWTMSYLSREYICQTITAPNNKNFEILLRKR